MARSFIKGLFIPCHFLKEGYSCKKYTPMVPAIILFLFNFFIRKERRVIAFKRRQERTFQAILLRIRFGHYTDDELAKGIALGPLDRDHLIMILEALTPYYLASAHDHCFDQLLAHTEISEKEFRRLLKHYEPLNDEGRKKLFHKIDENRGLKPSFNTLSEPCNA